MKLYVKRQSPRRGIDPALEFVSPRGKRGTIGAMTSNRHLDQRLKVQHFRAVDAIAAHGSLLKAATVLSVTQPALSRIVRDVEDILGVQLFRRNPRGVAPTAAGAAFIETARRLLA